VATISSLTSSNITGSGAGSSFTVTGNELVVYNGSSNSSNYGAGHDTLTLRSTAEAYAGGVASLAFANSNTGYPLGRMYAVDISPVTQGSGSSSIVFQSAVSNQLIPSMTITGSNVYLPKTTHMAAPLVNSNVVQPLIQYGTATGSGGTGTVAVTIPAAYTTSNSYVVQVTMRDAPTAQLYATPTASNAFTIGWSSAGSGTHTIMWTSFGT
jgi:hypothetical protein